MSLISVMVINEKDELICVFDKENAVEMAVQMCSGNKNLRWETVAEAPASNESIPDPEAASLFAPDFADAPGPNFDKVEDFVCPLGKHKGKQFGQILIDNPGYISWLSQQTWLRHDLREVVDEMMKRYAHEIQQGEERERQEFFNNRRR